MSDVENSKEAVALWDAVEKGDIFKVRELLDQGTSPNHVKVYTSSTAKALYEGHIEIFKLLVQNGAELEGEYFLMDSLFELESLEKTKELVSHIIKHNKNVEVLQNILVALINICGDSEEGLDIMKLLIDNELPLNEFISAFLFDEDEDQFTLLHLSIRDQLIDFVSLLLDRGADIHKKTGVGMSCLYLAAKETDESMIKLLLKRGAQINQRLNEGQTALHRACVKDEIDYIYLLCKYGADVNILDDRGKTPCMYLTGSTENKEVMVEEFAKLRFENHYLCGENLKFIQEDERLQKIFKNCLEELEKMKNLKFYNGYSMYDIFKMRQQTRKLPFLMKNDDFVEAYKSNWNSELFKHYGYYMNNTFQVSLEKKNILVNEEKKLFMIFKDYLPELVISKTVYFIHEYLFFD